MTAISGDLELDVMRLAMAGDPGLQSAGSGSAPVVSDGHHLLAGDEHVRPLALLLQELADKRNERKRFSP